MARHVGIIVKSVLTAAAVAVRRGVGSVVEGEKVGFSFVTVRTGMCTRL